MRLMYEFVTLEPLVVTTEAGWPPSSLVTSHNASLASGLSRLPRSLDLLTGGAGGLPRGLGIPLTPAPPLPITGFPLPFEVTGPGAGGVPPPFTFFAGDC